MTCKQLPPLKQCISQFADILAKGKTVIGEQAAVIAQLEPLRGCRTPWPRTRSRRACMASWHRWRNVCRRLRAGLIEAGKTHTEQQASTIATLRAELDTRRGVATLLGSLSSLNVSNRFFIVL